MVSCLYSKTTAAVATGELFTFVGDFINRCFYEVVSVYILFCIFLQFVEMNDRTFVQAFVSRLKKQPCSGPPNLSFLVHLILYTYKYG